MLILRSSASEGTGALRSGILQVVAIGDPAVCMDVDVCADGDPDTNRRKDEGALMARSLPRVRVWRFSTLLASKVGTW
jgi:hypothetical protein